MTIMDSLQEVLFQVCALGAILVLYLYWKIGTGYDYWKKRNAHYLKPTIFFGNIRDLLLVRSSDAEVYQKMYMDLEGHSYGGIFQLNQPALVIRDPDLIKTIMVKDFGNFHDRGFPVDEKNAPLSAHLFALAGQRWRKLRVKLTPTFTSGKMKAMFPILTQCAEEMIQNLEKIAKKKETIEMKEVLAQMTTDIIGSCAFGLQLNSMKDPSSKFRDFGRRILEPSASIRIRFLLAKVFPIIIKILRKLRGRELEKFFIGAVTDTVKYREQNSIQRNDFLDLLIQIKNKGKIEGDTIYTKEDAYLQNSVSNGPSDNTDDELVLTDNLLAAQCFVFFIGGFETSSTTASYCLHELAVNPEIQERLRAEVDSVLQEHDGKITYEALQKMKYMDQVVDETLRKYPPVPKLDRMCTKPFTLPGTDVVIEKGIPVVIPVYGIHHDSQYYPNPEKFDPERFSEENKATRPQFAYLPFGEGPRICIGMRFGLLQTKVGLAALLSKYKFSVSSKTSIPIHYEPRQTILSAKTGIWLQISDRSS